MAEPTQETDSSVREQGLLARQRALEGAVRQWENDLIAEGHTRNGGENERNIRALKARRTVLWEESRSVSRALKQIRRARMPTGNGVPERWRRWIGVDRA